MCLELWARDRLCVVWPAEREAMGSFPFNRGPPCVRSGRPSVYVSDFDGPMCPVCLAFDENEAHAWVLVVGCRPHRVLSDYGLALNIVSFLNGDGVADLCHPDCGQCTRQQLLAGRLCPGPRQS